MSEYGEEKARLESLGYQFEINEEPLSKPEESEYTSYYVVTVRYDGEVVGTRTELHQEPALVRALELADLHHRDPKAVAHKTLVEH